jgi:hypothetical protein
MRQRSFHRIGQEFLPHPPSFPFPLPLYAESKPNQKVKIASRRWRFVHLPYRQAQENLLSWIKFTLSENILFFHLRNAAYLPSFLTGYINIILLSRASSANSDNCEQGNPFCHPGHWNHHPPGFIKLLQHSLLFWGRDHLGHFALPVRAFFGDGDRLVLYLAAG